MTSKPPQVRIYGEICGLNPDACHQLANSLPFDHLESKESTLCIEHEGLLYDDLDDSLQSIADLLKEDGFGHVDYIDNEAWKMIRYTLSATNIKAQHINVDDYLDRYRYY